MIETILEEIRVLNLPLFWLTESEHGKRTTWSFVPDNPCNDIYSVTKVFTVTALGFYTIRDFGSQTIRSAICFGKSCRGAMIRNGKK